MSVNLTFVRLVLYSLINCLTQLTMKLAHHGHFPVCMAVSVLYVHLWWKWLTLEKNKSRTMYFSNLIWNKCHYPGEGERMGKARHHRWKEYSFVWWYVIPLITKQQPLAPLCINWIPLGLCKPCSVPFCSLQVLPLTWMSTLHKLIFLPIDLLQLNMSTEESRSIDPEPSAIFHVFQKFRLFSYFDQKFSETSVSIPKADSTSVLRVGIYV